MATPEEIRRAREETAFGGILGDFFAKNRQYRSNLANEGRRPVLGGLLSKEPVMGTDTLRYEGVRPLVGNLLEPFIKGGDTIRASRAGLIPQEDMLGEAFGAAGAAMFGGGLVPKPAGSLGVNASKSAGLLSVASDVSARGDRILNMLKSGKGSEVTDAMLDMGDGVKNTQLNQYLAANYDLPMDEASRLARAREMGFEGGLLHGTGSDITAVDPAKLGGKQNVLGKGFYQTTNPERSDRYVPRVTDDDDSRVFAEGGNVMPLMTKSADEFDLTVPTGKKNITRIANAFEGSDYDVELRDDGDSVFIKNKTDPNVSVFLDSYAEGQNTLMRLKDAFGNNNITPILQGAGFTGVKGVESRGSNVRVNYNPEDVRSQFARFDPRLSHLSNVTAANASPIGGLLAQSEAPYRQSQKIKSYLRQRGLIQ